MFFSNLSLNRSICQIEEFYKWCEHLLNEYQIGLENNETWWIEQNFRRKFCVICKYRFHDCIMIQSPMRTGDWQSNKLLFWYQIEQFVIYWSSFWSINSNIVLIQFSLIGFASRFISSDDHDLSLVTELQLSFRIDLFTYDDKKYLIFIRI